MNNNIRKIFINIILLILLFPVVSYANENTVDFSKKGIIEIELADSKKHTKVEGANICIYKIANAIDKDNNLSFDYHAKLKPYENQLNEGEITNDIINIIDDNNISCISQTTNKEGIVKFEDLELGLYLIIQQNNIENYSKITPFLIMLPRIVNNKWVYTVEATPKLDIIRLFDLSVEKKWNTIVGEKIPPEITVELLRNEKVIDTVILSESNNWNHTWKQIEESDEYIVKEINIPSGYKATYKLENNKFIITNTKTLLQTGQKTWLLILISLLGLLLVGGGIIIDKNENNK